MVIERLLAGGNRPYSATPLEAAKMGWRALLTKVNDKFEITGVCLPSDISEDPN